MNFHKPLSRRTFIKSGLVVAAGIPMMQSCTLLTNRNDDEADALFSLFKQPPVTAKPFVRWWWNGDKVYEEEILRELDVMKAAGIGGVEINPIAFPGGDDLGIPSLEWLSPKWIEMIKVALKGAADRGMICDIIVGSGWPFGAEFLEPEEQTQLLTLSSKKIKGPGKMTFKIADLLKEAAPEVSSMYKGTTSELHSICLAPTQMETFTPAIVVPFEKGAATVDVDVTEGEYILYSLVKFIGFQAVINGAPGASGPVLNHYNQKAVERFLGRMSDKLFPQLEGLKSFRAMFCDSMELEGANWCYDFADEFKSRRGYDVTPYLPYILYKVGHMGHAIEGNEITQVTGTAKEEIDRVRYDFFNTCMEITRDRFLKTYTQWCNKHGFKSRMQPYGREFHPLGASFEIDIPECETWIWHSESNKNSDFSNSPTYTNVNKFVASAAHYSGKKLISCEEVTNIRTVFNVTMERVKITGDQSNLSGVTHSILHGFNFSPPETPFPGWVRYGTLFSERNLWWPFFKLWSAYKARLSAVFQETEYFADIAVMHPLADMWTKHGPQRDPFPELRYPEYQYKVWEAIHQNGNSCDYTSEEVIQKSTSQKGFLKYNDRKYHTVMLIEVESMMPATAEALSIFVKDGGKVIFVGKEPHKSPGLVDYAANDAKVKQIIADMKQTCSSRVFLVDAPGEMIAPWFAKVQQQCGLKPYMSIANPNPYVSQIRRQSKGKDIFFIANCSTNEHYAIQVAFPESKGSPWLWDAEVGERYPYPMQDGNKLTIDLPPASSQLIVFDTEGAKGNDFPEIAPQGTGAGLNGWQLKTRHIEGKTEEHELTELADLSTIESFQNFAGHLIYEKTLDNDTSAKWIDLGQVFGVSEVTLNGEKLGCQWYGRHLYRIPEQLVAVKNKKLQVRISTTLGNYLKSKPEIDMSYRWLRHQEIQPIGMVGPVRLI